MDKQSSSNLFSQVALVFAVISGVLYALAAVSGLFVMTLFTGGLGLIFTAPVAVFTYIFVVLVVNRWRTRDQDPYADIEE